MGNREMGEFNRNSNVNEAQLIEVLEVKSIIGKGVTGNPIREIREYFAKDGTLLARTSGLEDLYVGEWTPNNKSGKEK